MMQLRDHWFTRALFVIIHSKCVFTLIKQQAYLISGGWCNAWDKEAALQLQQTVVKCLKDDFQGQPTAREPSGMKQVFSSILETQQPSRTEVACDSQNKGTQGHLALCKHDD